MLDQQQSPKKRPRNSWALAIVIGTASILIGLAAIYAWVLVGPKNTESTTQTYEASISGIDIDIASGNIDVSTGDGDSVVVTRTQKWVGDEPPAVTEGVSAGKLELVGHGCGLRFLPIPCMTSYEVEIPESVAVSAQTSSGNITVDGRTGAQQLSSSSGNISSQGNDDQTAIAIDASSGNVKLDGGGDVTVDVSSGSIELDGVTGKADVETSSGDITGRNLAVESMSLHTGSGSQTMQFDEAGKIEADTGSGSLDFTFATAPHSVVAETGSGDAHLAVPGSEKYVVDASTGSGDETVDVSTNAGAKSKLDVSTGSGDVVIAKAP